MKLKPSNAEDRNLTQGWQFKDELSALRKDFSQSWQNCCAAGNEITWLFWAMLIGIGVRGYYLSQPMRYDEAYTFLRFVNKDLSRLFYYPLPNNHVLHSLLAKASTLIWGANPSSIRLVAFLAGIGCIPLIYWLCRDLKQSGILATLAVSVFPYMVFYSTNARGYSLLILLTLSLALVGVWVAKRPSLAGAVLLAFIAALGMLTIPSMLFSIAGVFCWLLSLMWINQHSLRTILYKFVIPFGLLTIVFTIAFYIPVIIVSGGVATLLAKSLPWPEFLRQVYPHIKSTYRSIIHDVPKLALFGGLLLILMGIYQSFRKRNYPVLLLLPAMGLGAAIVFFIQHTIPYPRTWIYMIPFLLVVADAGFTFFLESVPAKTRQIVCAATCITAAFFAVSLITTNTIAEYAETGNFPEAPVAARFLKTIMTGKDEVQAKIPADWPMNFYLWYYHVPEYNPKKNSPIERIFYVVQKSQYSIEDLTDGPVIKLLEFDDMAVYQAVDARGP